MRCAAFARGAQKKNVPLVRAKGRKPPAGGFRGVAGRPPNLLLKNNSGVWGCKPLVQCYLKSWCRRLFVARSIGPFKNFLKRLLTVSYKCYWLGLECSECPKTDGIACVLAGLALFQFFFFYIELYVLILTCRAADYG